MSHKLFSCLLALSFLLTLQPREGWAQQNSSNLPSTSSQPDGQHDFDPLLGKWKYHLKRRLNPLTGSNQWVEFEGTGECYKIWDGSELDTIEVDGPTDGWPILTSRLLRR